ncbi:molybdenum cofactor guanylyltransferase [soil metagenome]|jgi:molybdopterin-guanine dinucleotide biosynthesis protein A
MENKFEGFVLAGGKSQRMKTDKAFLQIGGETFLTRAVKTLSSTCKNRVKIVLNKAQMSFIKRFPNQIPYIFDVYENRGALGGIHAALSDCQSGWAIILAVDLQLVTDEAIENLARIAFESKDFAAVVPIQMDGRPQPLCAVYRVEDCLPKLGNLLKEPTSASVRDFLKLVPTRFIGQDELATNGREDLFFNVNRPSDFQNLIDEVF